MAVSRNGVQCTECAMAGTDNRRPGDTTSALELLSGAQGGEISIQVRVSIRGGQAYVADDYRDLALLNFRPLNSTAANTGQPRPDLLLIC